MDEQAAAELEELKRPYKAVPKPAANAVIRARYPSRFRLLTWPEIQFEPRAEMLVKGLLEGDKLGLLYGESGSRKSFLAGDLGFHIARGSDWFGRKVLQSGVIYIAAEGGQSMVRRVEAFRRHNGLDASEPVPFALIASPVNLLDPQADLPELLGLLEEVATGFDPFPLRLIEIDTVSRALAGGNQNGPEDMGAFVRNLDAMRAKTGASILGIHHTGKDPSRGGRGHSLLKAAVDTEIEVVKQDDTWSVATVTKQRDGETGQAFAFTLKVVELGLDEGGEPIKSCVVMPVKGNTAAKPTKQKRIPPEYLKAFDYLNDVMADPDKSELATTNGIPRRTRVVHVDRWSEYLKLRGLHEGGENGKKWFQRVRRELVARERITINDPYVWIVRS